MKNLIKIILSAFVLIVGCDKENIQIPGNSTITTSNFYTDELSFYKTITEIDFFQPTNGIVYYTSHVNSYTSDSYSQISSAFGVENSLSEGINEDVGEVEFAGIVLEKNSLNGYNQIIATEETQPNTSALVTIEGNSSIPSIQKEVVIPAPIFAQLSGYNSQAINTGASYNTSNRQDLAVNGTANSNSEETIVLLTITWNGTIVDFNENQEYSTDEIIFNASVFDNIEEVEIKEEYFEDIPINAKVQIDLYRAWYEYDVTNGYTTKFVSYSITNLGDIVIIN